MEQLLTEPDDFDKPFHGFGPGPDFKVEEAESPRAAPDLELEEASASIHGFPHIDIAVEVPNQDKPKIGRPKGKGRTQADLLADCNTEEPESSRRVPASSTSDWEP